MCHSSPASTVHWETAILDYFTVTMCHSLRAAIVYQGTAIPISQWPCSIHPMPTYIVYKETAILDYFTLVLCLVPFISCNHCLLGNCHSVLFWSHSLLFVATALRLFIVFILLSLLKPFVVCKIQFYNVLALVKVMAWHWTGDKSLPEPMMT